MGIELAPGELRELNAQLTPLSVGEPITIEEFFVGTRRWGYTAWSDYAAYIALRNHTSAPISGTMRFWDWQGHGERGLREDNFTIPANGLFRNRVEQRLIDDLPAYIRIEVRIGDALIINTGPVHFIPGKIYTGNDSAGECTHTAPGRAILWYSQISECEDWSGSYRTPPQGQGSPIHRVTYSYTTRNYKRESWPAVYLAMLDPDLIPGARYQIFITGGPAAPRLVTVEWDQA